MATYLVKWMAPSATSSGASVHEHTVQAERFITGNSVGDSTVSFVDASNDTVFLIRPEHLISIERTTTEN